MDESYVEAAGARIRYLRAGSGPPLLLLHGLHGMADHWSWAAPALAERFTCYIPDLIGHGRSERIRSSYFLDDYGRYVLAFLDEVGIERASVIGNSLGGATAAWLAATAPSRVDRLVLLCPAGLGGAPLSEAVRWVIGLVETALGVRSEWLAQLGERNQFWDSERADPTFFASKTGDAIRRRRDPIYRRTTLRQAIGIARTAQPERLDPEQIPHPTLIVWGTADNTLRWEAALEMIPRFPNGRLVLLRECGHLPHVECPERFVDVALEHLAPAEAAAATG